MPLTHAEMSDRFEIQDLIVREASSLDRRDWDAYEACFTPDADIDYREAGSIRGTPAQLRAWLAPVLANYPLFQHLTSNCELSLRGDRASVRTLQYISLLMKDAQQPGGTRTVFQGIWFRDELLRTPAGWRIAKRYEEVAWRHNFPVDFRVPPPAAKPRRTAGEPSRAAAAGVRAKRSARAKARPNAKRSTKR